MLSYARNAALSPIWMAQRLTQTRSFARNPLLGGERLDAMGLQAARARMAHRPAQSRRRRLARLVSEEDRAAFDRDGFLAKRDFLSQERFAALVQEAKTFKTTAREMTEGDAITRRIPFPPENLARLPAARALAEDPAFQGFLRAVGSDNAESPRAASEGARLRVEASRTVRPAGRPGARSYMVIQCRGRCRLRRVSSTACATAGRAAPSASTIKVASR